MLLLLVNDLQIILYGMRRVTQVRLLNVLLFTYSNHGYIMMLSLLLVKARTKVGKVL